jgi:hypothetical protein
VVDRARVLEDLLTDKLASAPAIHAELVTLSRRAKLISRVITLCTTTASLICAIIAILFIGASLGFHTAIPVVILFVLAMLTFFTGLLAFLREVLLATATLRIGPQAKGSLD